MKRREPKVAFYYTLDFQKNVLVRIAAYLKHTFISNDVEKIRDWNPDFIFTADYSCRFLSEYFRNTDVEILAIRHGAVNKYSQPEDDFAFADYVFGTEYEKKYLESGGIKPKQEFIITGNAWIDESFQINKKEINFNSPTILFAPTYNPEISAASVPGNKLYELISEIFTNFRLIIKPHPAIVQCTMEHLIKQKEIFLDWMNYWHLISKSYDNVRLITDSQLTANKFFNEADILISDKSSLIWEFIILELPVLLYKTENVPEFWSNQITDFSIDYKLDVGAHYKNCTEFKENLNKLFSLHQEYFIKKQQQYKRELFGEFQDGKSSERIANEIIKIFNSNLSQNLIFIAENHIKNNSLTEAKEILSRAKHKNKTKLSALNDLAYIEILENNYNEAFSYILDVLRYNPNDEIALNNLNYLIENNLIDLSDGNKNIIEALFGKLQMYKAFSFDDFLEYENQQRKDLIDRKEFELSLIPKGKYTFQYLAYCVVCESLQPLEVDLWNAYDVNGIKIPNWRERLVCPSCGLNNRMRLTYHIVNEIVPDFQQLSVYITEQTTSFFQILKKINNKVVGSEFLGEQVSLGGVNNSGIRNEDFTKLTFDNNQFDLIISLEVLEHIPNYKQALKESFRVLKPNGKILFTVPFNRNSKENIIRAKVNSDGSVTHLLPPEYHGDPVSGSNNCLCYYHFGWELLNDLKEAGYKNSYALLTYSKEYGYLGGDQIFFIAEKGDN